MPTAPFARAPLMPRPAPLLPVMVLAWLLLPGLARADMNVLVGGAWVRQPPPGSDTAAVYFVLRNAGTEPTELVGVDCAAARMAMLHETRESGGEARMRMVGHLTLKPGDTVELRPGGLHIMLSGLTRSLAVGDRVELTLRFAQGLHMHVTAVVRPLGS